MFWDLQALGYLQILNSTVRGHPYQILPRSTQFSETQKDLGPHLPPLGVWLHRIRQHKQLGLCRRKRAQVMAFEQIYSPTVPAQVDSTQHVRSSRESCCSLKVSIAILGGVRNSDAVTSVLPIAVHRFSSLTVIPPMHSLISKYFLVKAIWFWKELMYYLLHRKRYILYIYIYMSLLIRHGHCQNKEMSLLLQEITQTHNNAVPACPSPY